MNSLDSIGKAVDQFLKHNIPYALLHTTNLYPTPNHLVRLGAITEIAERFSGAVLGLSDHTISNHACFGAVALGASILERHFTDHMKREGPDIICSMDEKSAEELIAGVNIISSQREKGKFATREEQVTMDFAFSSVVSIKDIEEGEIFSLENIWVKRPGSGEISASQFKKLIGKQAKSNIRIGSQIKKSQVKNYEN